MFHGSIVAIVTPMQLDGAVDFDCFQKLLAWHIESGTDGVVVLGTTGESPTINAADRQRLIHMAVDYCKGKVPVIAGTGTNSTQTTIELTQAAMDAGVEACLLVTPYYNKPTQDGLYLHYKAISEAVGVPQILYNVPGRTGCDLLPETIARLADLPNIIGVKEATGDVDRVKHITQLTNSTIDLYSGDDTTACEFMLAGGKGVISVTANVAPSAMKSMTDAAINKDAETARKLNDQLNNLHASLFIESNPIPTKWALHKMGKIPAGIRMPLTPLSEANQRVVEDALIEVGIISTTNS